MSVEKRIERIKQKNINSQSNSFLQLRHKMQIQMKKNNVNYEDILDMTAQDNDGK